MSTLSQQLVLREDGGAVRVSTMNRLESRNALNTDSISALHTALVSGLVLTGVDPAFCAGLDFKQVERDGSAYFERLHARDVCATATFYGTEPKFIPDIGHAMTVEPRWPIVAECILSWLALLAL